MQNDIQATETLTPLAQAQAISAATGAGEPVSTNGKAAAKRVAKRTKAAKQPTPAVPVAKAKPAKPTAEAREAAQRDANDARRLARDVAAAAVSAFYSGASKPFKAASDRFADLNPNNAKSPSTRQAGLMLALITYGRGNIKPNGDFVRGGFIVPAKLINPNAKPGETVRAQPESGCLGNMLGRTVKHVSGPVTGKAQADAVFRLDAVRAIAEIQAAFGDKPANAAAAILGDIGCAVERKPAKAKRAAKAA